MKNWIKAISYTIGGFAIFGANVILTAVCPTYRIVTFSILVLFVIVLLVYSVKKVLDEKEDDDDE